MNSATSSGLQLCHTACLRIGTAAKDAPCESLCGQVARDHAVEEEAGEMERLAVVEVGSRLGGEGAVLCG